MAVSEVSEPKYRTHSRKWAEIRGMSRLLDLLALAMADQENY